jgi:hypothetical protein
MVSRGVLFVSIGRVTGWCPMLHGFPWTAPSRAALPTVHMLELPSRHGHLHGPLHGLPSYWLPNHPHLMMWDTSRVLAGCRLLDALFAYDGRAQSLDWTLTRNPRDAASIVLWPSLSFSFISICVRQMTLA